MVKPLRQSILSTVFVEVFVQRKPSGVCHRWRPEDAMGVERKDWADTAVLLRDLRKYFYWKQIFSIKNKTFFSKTNYPLQNRIYFFVILIFHFWLVLKDRILFWNKVVFFEKKNLFYHFETKYFLSKTKLTFQIPKENYFISIARIFKGDRFFIEKGKAGSERSERCLRWWVPRWSPGRHSISLDLKAPDCEKIEILNAFFLSEFFQYIDIIYGGFYGGFCGDTFVATNFLIFLFLFFPNVWVTNSLQTNVTRTFGLHRLQTSVTQTLGYKQVTNKRNPKVWVTNRLQTNVTQTLRYKQVTNKRNPNVWITNRLQTKRNPNVWVTNKRNQCVIFISYTL